MLVITWASLLILENVSVYAGNSYRNRGTRACYWSRSVSASSCYLHRGMRARYWERECVPLVVVAIGASLPVSSH